MAWDKTTITNNYADAAISDRLKTLCGGSGVANWSFIENVPAGAGAGQSGTSAYSVDVFKCAGTSTDANDAGVDFYVAISRTVATNQNLYVMPFLLYSPIASGSNKGMCAAPVAYPGTGGTSAPDSTTYAFDYTTGSPNYRTFYTRFSSPSVTNGTRYYSNSLNNTGFVSAIKLDKNYIILTQVVGASSYGCGVSLMDSFVSNVTDTYPLVFFYTGSTSLTGLNNGNSIFLTLPGISSADISTSGVSYPWQAMGSGWTPNALKPTGNTINSNDRWLNNRLGAQRVEVVHYAFNSSDATAGSTWPHYTGYNRGLLKSGILCIGGGSGTISPMDTLTIDGNADWTVVSIISSLVLNGHLVTRAI